MNALPILLDSDQIGRVEGYYGMLCHTPDAEAAQAATEYVLSVLHLRLVLDATHPTGWALVPLERPIRPHYEPGQGVPTTA